MKKIISIVLAVLMMVSVFTVMPLTANAAYEKYEHRQTDEFEYVLYKDENTVEIYQYIGNKSEVVIPDELDGSPVTKISRLTFEGCDFVTGITAPDTITAVGDEAFCDTAFYKDNSNWVNGVLYLGSILVEADENLEGEYTVKEGTTVIASYAFVDCEKLTKITIPGTVKHIADKMFTGCKALETAILEEGVENIDESVFEKCSKLENIQLPKSITRVGFRAFNKTGFYNNDYNWENGALYYNNILITVDTECDGNFYVKDGTTVLGDYAFMECNVTNIYLPDGIKVLPFALTQNCLWLENIYAGDDLEELGSYVVSEDINIAIPDSVKKIGYRAFFQSRFTEIKLPENLKEIGVEAFLSCSHLKEITIPRNVEKIGHEALGYRMSGIGEGGYLTEKEDGLVIKGYPGTAAETYAKENGFEFVDITVKNISGCTVTDVKNKTYNGKSQIQSITVKDGDKILSADTDYSIQYKNNKNAGTATVTITGKGYYSGQIKKTFKISKAANPITVKVTKKTLKLSAVKKKAQNVKVITVSKAQGKVSYKLTGVSKALSKLVKINSKGVITISKWAKAKTSTYKIKVKISAAGGQNYNSKVVNKTVNIIIK